MGWAATPQNVQQLNAQPTIGGGVDNVIVFNAYGFMLCTDIQAACGIQSHLYNAGNFALFPWNDGLWTAASLCQLQALRGYASNVGDGDLNKGLSLMGIGSHTTADIVFWIGGDCGESYSITRYNITKGTTSTATKGNSEYLVVRGTPAPNEALASLQAMVYPTSLDTPSASSTLVDSVTLPLLRTFGVCPPISYLYDYL